MYLRLFIAPDCPVTTLYSPCHPFSFLDLNQDIKFNLFTLFRFLLPHSSEIPMNAFLKKMISPVSVFKKFKSHDLPILLVFFFPP